MDMDLVQLEKKYGKLGAEAPQSALAKWQPDMVSAKSGEDATINIYSVVGEDYSGEGVTAKLVASILRKNEGKAVTVNINSPGGSFFEGLAIYNMLREHDGDVNVKIVGLAASAASVIAMAGDTIEIAESGFIMIHNAWSIAVGNKHDMKSVSEVLAKFDESMISIYSRATSKSSKDLVKMCDAETWLMGEDAIENGFATALLASDSVKKEEVKDQISAALRKIDIALAKDGCPRSERRAMIKDLTSKPSAAVEPSMPSASDNIAVVLNQILQKLTIN